MAAYHVKNTGCFSCPIACKSYVTVPNVGHLGVPSSGEFLCLSATWYDPPGSTPKATFAAKQLIDTLGLNPWDLYMWVSLLRWMHDTGKITEKEAGLPFSDEKMGGERFITTLCRKVAHRDGIGDIIAEGLPRGAEKLGVLGDIMTGEAATVVPLFHHGMMQHYDPRAFGYVEALLWIMDNRDPNRHENSGMLLWSGAKFEEIQQVAKAVYGSERAIDPIGTLTPYDPAKGSFAISKDHNGIIKDSLPTCDWLFPVIMSPHPERKYMGDTSIESKLFSAVTGIKWSETDLNKAAERCWNLQRAITVRDWKTASLREGHDKLRDLYFTHPVDKKPFEEGGPLSREDFEKAMTDYYKQRGWDEKTGAPTRKKLEELDLKDVAEKLDAMKLLPA